MNGDINNNNKDEERIVSLKDVTNYSTSADTSILVDAMEGQNEEAREEGETTNKPNKPRAQWDNRIQFLLTLIGFAVGLGNVWRFSYYVKKNGGGAFLIPYFTMLFVVGIPLFYLELTLGQKMRRGSFRSWFKICPPLAGIGIASVVTITYISMYYNVIISWVLFYFVNSFHAVLPWEKCCEQQVDHTNVSALEPTTCSDVPTNYSFKSCTKDVTKFYWYNRVTRVSDDIGTAGEFNWRLLLCLFAAWVITYLCLFRGIKSSGKVAYVTAVFPYIVLIILFFRGVTLEGAGTGIEFLFKPEWNKLYLPQVWLEAATQIFFSLGISTGGIIALSSYSTSVNTALRDSTFVCIINSATSLFSSITIFSILGYRANESKESIDEVADGPGLAFNALTEAINLLPGSPFWAVLFFTMLITLGVDSQFTSLESLLTVLFDNKHIAKVRKEIIVAIVCVVLFLISIPFSLGCGLYLFQLFDQFAGTIPLLLIAIFELIAVAWVYGTRRFLTDVVKPDRQGVVFFWWLLWTFVSPLIMIIVFIGSLVTNFTQPLEYVRYSNYDEIETPYPGWARFVGSLLILSAVLPIPAVIVARLVWKKDEREEAIKWFVDFPKRCIAAWDDFKQLCVNLRNSFKERSFRSRIVGVCNRCPYYRRSWSPQPSSPYVDMEDETQNGDGEDL